jgi:hypothetical protein
MTISLRLEAVSTCHCSGHLNYLTVSKLPCLSADDLYVKYVTTFYLKKLEDGEDYLTPDKYKVDFEPRHLKARLDNLFNGNKLLGERGTCVQQFCVLQHITLIAVCVIHFRAHDQYSKTEPTYAHYYLFSFLFIFPPTCFGK